MSTHLAIALIVSRLAVQTMFIDYVRVSNLDQVSASDDVLDGFCATLRFINEKVTRTQGATPRTARRVNTSRSKLPRHLTFAQMTTG